MENKASKPVRGRQVESPKKHYVAFAVSILLTIAAFAAVGLGLIQNATLLIAFILVLAIIQAAYQMLVWMHMKEEGHRWPAVMIVTGAAVAVITVIALYIWIWDWSKF